MTLREFENGYWYRTQLKDFAERIGIPAAAKLRKDELEKAIVVFLRTGNAALPTKRSLRRTGLEDIERGLHLKLRIENYTSNRETKDFIIDMAGGRRGRRRREIVEPRRPERRITVRSRTGTVAGSDAGRT